MLVVHQLALVNTRTRLAELNSTSAFIAGFCNGARVEMGTGAYLAYPNPRPHAAIVSPNEQFNEALRAFFVDERTAFGACMKGVTTYIRLSTTVTTQVEDDLLKWHRWSQRALAPWSGEVHKVVEAAGGFNQA